MERPLTSPSRTLSLIAQQLNVKKAMLVPVNETVPPGASIWSVENVLPVANTLAGVSVQERAKESRLEVVGDIFFLLFLYSLLYDANFSGLVAYKQHILCRVRDATSSFTSNHHFTLQSV